MTFVQNPQAVQLQEGESRCLDRVTDSCDKSSLVKEAAFFFPVYLPTLSDILQMHSAQITVPSCRCTECNSSSLVMISNTAAVLHLVLLPVFPRGEAK